MRKLTAVFVCLVAGPILAAQLAVTPSGCSNAGQELRQPMEIRADAQTRVLRTELDIRQFVAKGVLVYHSTGCQALPDFNIRNYGWRPAPGKPFEYGYPAPTLRLRKGDALQLLLTNNLPDLGSDACNQECDKSDGSGSQCASDTTATLPNCFHGNNTTNLHFHGLHVSPQSPQDFVLLELQPAGSKPAAHASHGPHAQAHAGSFLYSVNPLPWNQPEGTHWYHPHKHGSTALQVGNGMAGALIVEGAFDDWLNAQFPQPPREKILVLQQIHDLNFLTAASTDKIVLAPIPLVNGQIAPKITMYPGEIQRWRFIAATIDASAQLQIDFNGPANEGAVAKQISMDGVQFAPENYQKQPLLPTTKGQFRISPGNRADFLVQAPAQAGKYSLTYEVFGNVGLQGTKRRQKNTDTPAPTIQNVRTVLDAIAPGDAEPVLLTIEVAPCNDTSKCPAMDFPSALPPLPWYLRNVGPVDTSQQHTLGFFTNNIAAQPQTIGILVDTTDETKIRKFDPDCAVFTQPLGSRGEWTINQTIDPSVPIGGALPPFHVFHIHTNAFQVMSNGGATYDPPIWMDSITLPLLAQGPVVMRTRFEDYTGNYVLHCHFLGHEDRGMMLSVQTVCANDPGTYGTPDPRGGPDQCTVPIAKALKPCGAAGRRVVEKE